jgi:hypothetical protein
MLSWVDKLECTKCIVKFFLSNRGSSSIPWLVISKPLKIQGTYQMYGENANLYNTIGGKQVVGNTCDSTIMN